MSSADARAGPGASGGYGRGGRRPKPLHDANLIQRIRHQYDPISPRVVPNMQK